ncbi:MAG: choice-of-anchor D domain-containing protein, partial [Candidatus Cloacimonadales bacterium]
GPSVVYKLTLPTSKIMDISLSGTAWDTKMWVFNSFDDINTATVNADAWYYNDDESSAGTGGGRFIEVDKTRDRATWSKMNPSFALAGDYYIVISGYSSNSGDFTMTINSENIPAPALATSPFPATTAVNQPSALNLAWTNAQYTETVDIYFGVTGSMVMVQNNVPVVAQYAVSGLATATTYEWKVVNRNYSGISATPAVTWTFTTTADAPVAATYTAPANNATNVAKTGNLTWGAVTGADGYKVYLSEDNAFTGVTPVVQTTTSYAYSGDFATTYFWKVIPYNVIGDATGTIATWSFTTAPSPFPNADLIFDGVRAVNHGMPMEPWYGYTVTQNIYYQSELNIDNAAITSISYLYNNYSAWDETIEIYMGHTNKDVFNTTTDWITAGFTHVYSGTMFVNTVNPIVTINLDTPFVYNNTDNLVVLFYATQNGAKSNSDEFYNYPVVGNRSITARKDGTTPYVLHDATVVGTLKAFRPVTGFNYQVLSAEPQFVVSAETLTFVDQEMNTESSPQTLTISNLGLADLGITGLVLTGTDAGQFQLTDTNGYPVTLATAENMTVQVVYAPTTAGDHTAVLQITDNQMRVVNTVQLVGNSLDPNIYEIDLPYTLGFENEIDLLGWTVDFTSASTSANAGRYLGASSAHTGSYSARIYHTGASTSAELISPLVVPDMNLYRVRFWAMKSNTSNTDPIILGKYDAEMNTFTQIQSIALTTTFAEYTVDMLVADRANERFVFKFDTTQTAYQYIYIDDVVFEAIPLTALAELSVTAVDFGEVPVLTTSTSRTVSIKNVGVGALTITDVAITGADASMFDWDYVATEPNMALANNESLAINVTFTPASAGDKVATLVITDNLGRAFRVNSATKTTNSTRAANNVTLTGNGWVPPQGSTCADPIPLTFPANITDNTIHYGDDYESAMITPSSGYMGGDDVVYQFTFANSMVLNGSIVTPGTWIGAFILENEPNVTTPAPVTHSNTASGNTLNYYDVFIPAGTYYLIISSFPAPQNIAYTINLTADPLPMPGAATNPTPATATLDQATALTLSWNNANYTETVDLWFGIAGA